ncbi:conserved repeat domain-containing protein [Thiothrix caldifontis]|uniref:Conserved repeat domain-containing protein n=1 Tax=Thiothrix caldifontis TaxID=525918 RepID=A0A1H4GS22_9GAMM|nr:SdrD B-like domain-containing protein [Thiothrix caldifontis]SEB12317.1 conserved repeat domain-containing protein [Thiothrix caldifontis]
MKSNKIPYYARYAGVGLLLSAAVVQADISGKVFHDFNGNGTFDTASPQVETGVAGVIVTATDATGSTASATTAADGTYTFPNSGATATGNKVRIEFSNLPEFSNSGSSATGTTTQFVTANAADVNFAVTYADNFCQANPQMVTPLYRSGADNNQVLRFSYNNEGLSELDKTNIATSSVIGSLWGVAYSRSQKQLYAAAVLKRHIPLGSGGLDAIYTVDPNTGVPNATPWLQLTDDLGIAVSTVSANPQYQDNSERGVDAPPQNDASAFTDVMKVGIGDIELSADEKTLYAMNVYDKKVYAIDVASKTLKGSYALPDASCSNGQSRPWALGEHQGKIYAGVTCDGSASGNPANLADDSGAANLKASVYRLDGAAFTQVLTFPLDYPREPPFQYDDKCKVITKWKPWADTLSDTCTDGNISYPSPVLSDIEFEDNGNMILGFTDRTGFQVGHKNYGPTGTTLYSLYVAGDILKACKTASGWGIEGTVAGCSSAGGLAINQADPDGYPMSWGDILDKAGEFYEGDFFHGDGNTDGTGLSYFPGHPEIIVGGLSVVPNTGEVMSVTYDPVTGAANYGTGGVITLNNQSGKRTRNGFELYRTTDADPTTASKGVGLGDLEVLCDPAPIEVGNRVWNDTDGDGIQDADEAGIDGVEVVLTCGADTATVTTANGGQFLFSSASNATFMSAGESCKVTVNSAGQTSLDGLIITKQNADNVTDNQATTDLRDSDATSVGEIAFTVGNVGENNHTLDIGYKAAPVVDAWCPVGAVENFLLNGSFEQGAAGDNAPNWTGENNISTSSSVNPKPHGSQFAFTWTPETFYQDADISSVPEGQALKLSYYSGSHEPSDQAVSIQYLTAPGGTVIGTAQALAVTHDVDSDAQLAQQELILGAKPAGANAVRVSVYGGSVDFIKIDAMCLYAGEVQAQTTDVKLTKDVTPATAKRGDTVVYTLTVSNESDIAATGVTVTDKLPDGIAYVSDDGETVYGSDVYDDTTGVWTVGDLAKDESKILKITVTVQ